MRKYKYVGAEPVDVPALGLVDVEPGDEVDVTDDVGAGMEGQPQWEPVEAAPPKSTKKASQQVADDSQEG